MFNCPMCGKDTNQVWARSYQYDNGETQTMLVCDKCEKVHQQSLRGQK